MLLASFAAANSGILRTHGEDMPAMAGSDEYRKRLSLLPSGFLLSPASWLLTPSIAWIR